MDEKIIRQVAQQLRKPEGKMGREISERMNKGNMFMNLRTIKSLKVAPGDNILEIGMGNGFFVKEILSVDKSIKYTGCDYSELMIELAENLNYEFVKDGRAKFFLATADNIPSDKAAFNKVYTVNTIYFWEDPEKVLSEFCRVLKPGGLLIITYTPKWLMKEIPFVKYGFKVYSDDEVKSLISKNGFKVISIVEETEPPQDSETQSGDVASVVLTAERIS